METFKDKPPRKLLARKAVETRKQKRLFIGFNPRVGSSYVGHYNLECWLMLRAMIKRRQKQTESNI